MRGAATGSKSTRGSRFRSSSRALLPAALVLLLVLGLAAPALAAGEAQLEACFLAKINSARASNGAQALTLSSTLAEYGRSHSRRMAQAGNLFHSSSSDLAPYLPAGWRSWGENVGVGGGTESCDPLFQAFWNSAGHRANLLNPKFNLAGIGVYIDDTVWTTHVFVETAASTTTTTQPPTTTTTTQPPTTTTTQPPTTTTTQPPTTTTTRPPTTTTTRPPTTTTQPPTTTTQPPTTTTRPPTTTTQPPTTTTQPPTTTTADAGAQPGSTTTSPPGRPAVAEDSTPSGAGRGPGGAPAGVGPSVEAAAGIAGDCDGAACAGGQGFLVAIVGLMLTGGAIATWSFRH